MTYLIIFCNPILEDLVSCDVISQYKFFERSYDVFKKNNYIIKYFYDFLSDDSKLLYTDISINFNKNIDYIKNKYNEDCIFILKTIIDDEIYNNSFILGFESIGFDKISSGDNFLKLKNKNMKIIMSIYDPHSFFKVHNLDEINVNKNFFWNTHNRFQI